METNKNDNSFKVKVAIEAISERETPNELAARYNVPQENIILWKDELTKHLGAAFKTPEKGNKLTIKDDGIILCTAFYSFQFLKNFSLFRAIEKLLDHFHNCTNKALYSEIWVIFNLILSIVISLIIRSCPSIIGFLLCCWAACRSFGIFVYQMNVLLFDPITTRKKGEEYKIKNATRTILMLFINFAEYIFWFSSIYLYIKGPGTSYWEIFTHSFEILANISDGDYKGKILIVVTIEAIIGIFMNLVCLARFLSMLPPVKSQNEE